ncbi:hypothetical protein LTR84_004777 [Exophiala bonariae]|uniref:AB hydrolase-1 domain-containing protein n=1 Tax=Exophiala bonariae TaxID=1690606 RepID=A0AAV9NMV5_9EURO|nr:hypothetical protein LTR84_004777 [Exophiala bonariae]
MAQENATSDAADVFYVGGKYVKDSRGTRMTGQMCVRRYGKKVPQQPAVIYIHGAAQTGTHWESTPDNRPGIAILQAQAGWECFVIDQPGIGRSRYHSDDIGELSQFTVEELQGTFTAPETDAWPQAKFHMQWPGSGKMGDPTFDAFYASQVGHIGDYGKVERLFRANVKALLSRTGPAFVVAHSQGGLLGWHTADECPDLVRGIVGLEPNGPPFIFPGYPAYYVKTHPIGKIVRPFGITYSPLTYDPPLPPDATSLPMTEIQAEKQVEGRVHGMYKMSPLRTLPNLASMPVILLTGEASYHAPYDHLTVEFLRTAGVQVEHIRLEDHGIRGNGHMLGSEKNNHEIQALINTWLMKWVK